MNQNTSIRRTFAILALPRRVPALITYAQSVVAAMTSNTHFPAPIPTLTEVSAAILALQNAESAALSRLKGAVVVRNDRKAALVTLLQELRGYIQKCADADPENGAAIIRSSGLPARKMPARQPRVFTVKPGAVSGAVDVVAATAAHRASYEWQYSTDGGKTWIEAAPSLRAKTTITGLPVATVAQFRYRSVTKAGPSDWSQPVTLVVK